METPYYVYVVTNWTHAKSYVGMSKSPEKMFVSHMGGTGNRLIKEDVEKYGKEHFGMQFLSKTTDREEAVRQAKSEIMKLGCMFPMGYNLTLGAEGSKDHLWNGKQRKGISGERNSRAKLTEAKVVEILRDPGKRDDIAAKHGVSPATITGIKNRTKWMCSCRSR